MHDQQPSPPARPNLLMQLAPAALDATEAAEYLRISDSLLEKLVREGGFPPPRQLSGRRVVYLVSELNDWLYSRPVSNIAPPPSRKVA
jgi:prophage regulatory protein